MSVTLYASWQSGGGSMSGPETGFAMGPFTQFCRKQLVMPSVAPRLSANWRRVSFADSRGVGVSAFAMKSSHNGSTHRPHCTVNFCIQVIAVRLKSLKSGK
jgi:hypothetical protein